MKMLKKYPSDDSVLERISNINRTPHPDNNLPPVIKFRHYKGDIYKYICDATLEWCPGNPNSHVIVYESVTDGKRWCRLRNEFFGYVRKDGKLIRRFEKI